MKFKIYTIVDITETKARKGSDIYQLKQEQNFQTIVQTVGLRANPTYTKSPKLLYDAPYTLGIGTVYRTKKNIWEFVFDIEYEDALTIDNLKHDFNHVPIILGLNESSELQHAYFVTDDSRYTNISFHQYEF